MNDTYAHFIGVGGAGMSGLALVLHQRGVAVTGSDLKESRYLRALGAAGVDVRVGHDAAHVGDPEVVVVSAAIPDGNPELAEARRRGIPVWPRARMLAHLAGDRCTIAVAGTHGKTSTSSMVATMLRAMDLDPTFLIGGEVDGVDTNARNGSGTHYVVEADESDGSFVHLDPFISVVTNIEADHLDYYGSLDEIERAFERFLTRTAEHGMIVACADDERALSVARRSGRRVVTYGFASHAEVRCGSLQKDGVGHRFTVSAGTVTAKARVAVPGRHMVSNATAALAVAYALGLDPSSAARAVSTYSGVRRRFDLVGEAAGVTVVDDYAHHPTEVSVTLQAAASLGHRRVWALFQPHRFSRTAALADEFGRAFQAADGVVMTDVYSAGEAPIPGVSGKTLVSRILRVQPRTRIAYLPHRDDIVSYLLATTRPGDLVLTMGAGDVTAIGPQLVEKLRAREGAAS